MSGFAVDIYFGIRGESRFYQVSTIDPKGNMVLNRFQTVGENEAVQTHEKQFGYNTGSWDYRNSKGDVWFGVEPIVPVVRVELYVEPPTLYERLHPKPTPGLVEPAKQDTPKDTTVQGSLF